MEKFDIIINQLGRINHEVFFNVVFKMGEGRGGLILTLPRLPLHPSTPSKNFGKKEEMQTFAQMWHSIKTFKICWRILSWCRLLLMVLLKTWNIDDFNCTFCNWQKQSVEVFYKGVILVRISLFYRTPLVAATDLKIFRIKGAFLIL